MSSEAISVRLDCAQARKEAEARGRWTTDNVTREKCADQALKAIADPELDPTKLDSFFRYVTERLKNRKRPTLIVFQMSGCPYCVLLAEKLAREYPLWTQRMAELAPIVAVFDLDDARLGKLGLIANLPRAKIMLAQLLPDNSGFPIIGFYRYPLDTPPLRSEDTQPQRRKGNYSHICTGFNDEANENGDASSSSDHGDEHDSSNHTTFVGMNWKCYDNETLRIFRDWYIEQNANYPTGTLGRRR